MSKTIVFFDGECALCNWVVRFITPRDPSGVFHFAPLQSSTSSLILQRHGCVGDSESVVLLMDGQCFRESTAALLILNKLNGLWPLLHLLRILPKPLRDGLYRWVARNRTRWFGRTSACLISLKGYEDRFLI
jgi:predicted DCC family thiol-disulfide oxidoreductase YuxK